MKKILLSTLIISLIISTYIKFAAVSGYNFPFTMDQGRDMVDIRQMVVSHIPRLVGPTTSINGVLLGPFWYYFNLLPFLIGRGDPAFVVYWQIIWYQLGALTLWYVIKRHNSILAFITAFLLLLSPNGFNTSRYFWNANSMPIMTMFFLATFIYALENFTLNRLMLLGFISGLAMQFEAAFGVIFFPFAFVYLILRRQNLKKLLFLTSGFIFTLLPQVFFEIRHQFVMSKIFLTELTGQGTMLGDRLNLTQRITDRWLLLQEQIQFLSHIPMSFLKPIVLVAFLISLYLIFYKKYKEKVDVKLLSFSFLFFIGLFYLGFSQKLKNWYVLGVSVPLTLLLASVFSFIYETKNKFLQLFIGLILFAHLINALIAQFDYLTQISNRPSNDPSNLKNELAGFDWIYNEAHGKAFSGYNYIPSVYDYSYNYLYWWYGTSKYGYQPSDTAYLPNQPEYISTSSKTWLKRKNSIADDPVYLFIEIDKEMPEREQRWLGNFSTLCQTKSIQFPWGIEIKQMNTCVKNGK